LRIDVNGYYASPFLTTKLLDTQMRWHREQKHQLPHPKCVSETLSSTVAAVYLHCQGLVPRTNTMVADIVKGKRGKAKAGKGAAAGGGGEGDELAGEGLAGDAEGGAALAEEAGLPGDVQVRKHLRWLVCDCDFVCVCEWGGLGGMLKRHWRRRRGCLAMCRCWCGWWP
jgi:hypothetical protein